MAHEFNKQNFKNYLHENCHRSWFSKSNDNARYKTNKGIYDVEDYSLKYTVRVKDILYDPSTYGVDGQAVAGSALCLATTAGSIGLGFALAPFTSGGSLLMVANAKASAGMTMYALQNMWPSRAVYFTITGDNSEWRIGSVEWYEIEEVAKNICEWSNEVYVERYINQEYIEYRPPTPY